METITLEINKRTKDGKTLLDMIEFYLANAKGVKIKNLHTQADLKPEVLKSMEENDKKGMENLKSFSTTEELFEDLEI